MNKTRYILIVILLLNLLISLLSAQMGVPTLNNPQDRTDYYSIVPAYFDWSPADSAEFYEIIVVNAPDFESPVFNESVTNTSAETYDLFYNWQFYWKVRAGRDSSGYEVFSDWSETFSFTSEYTPPANQTPQDGSFEENYDEVHFFWDMSLDPVVEGGNNTYRFQLATDNEFETLISDKEINTEKNTQVIDLQPGTLYYWRVKYSNDYGESSWSDITSFQTKNAELEQVALVEPEDNVINIYPLDVEFVWQDVSGADSYMFELAEDSSFTKVIESTSTDTTSYTTNIYIYEVKLFWRVQALGGDAVGPWSDVWRLTTGKIAPQTPPVLVSPGSNANDLLPDSIRFDWNEVSGADEYTIQIATDSDFNNLFYINDSLTSTYNIVRDFVEETFFYWRVMSGNNIGNGPWSEIWVFTTKTNTGLSEGTNIVRSLFLEQNYPNPFNGGTTIKFSVPEAGEVEIVIYNALGQKVKTLDKKKFNPGFYKYQWDGRNEHGSSVATAVYFYILKCKNVRLVKKMVYMK